MATSVFDLFSIGIGPSSSHTVGPMRAARHFAEQMSADHVLDAVERVVVDLYGSLAATGKAHGTDKALILGLLGERPESVDPDAIDAVVAAVREAGTLSVLGRHEIAFDEGRDVIVHRREHPVFHPNALGFSAFSADGALVASTAAYSVGGGFVVYGPPLDAKAGSPELAIVERQVRSTPPLPFSTAAELLAHCDDLGTTPAGVMLENERTWRDEEAVRAGLLELWSVMRACVERGLGADGCLPGFLAVPRRAAALHRQLLDAGGEQRAAGLDVMAWLNCFALAVSEENAAGGRVVTAPTNGAAGIIPAVLHYYERFVPGASDAGVIDFLLTAGAIGILCKENASISGAEVGCQGEVGSACAMAAGGLAAALGGSARQIENAAEIGIEHNLGLTCDPVGGLVQVPCIERNAMAAVKAVNAAQMALRGDGSHVVSLDKALRTMRLTGEDMKTKYKETARGGLALSVPEC